MQANVRGRVQGVGFRFFVLDEARRLGVRGHTRNLPDGSVEVVAVGVGAALDRLVQRLHLGPGGARVESVHCAELSPPPPYEDFEIRL